MKLDGTLYSRRPVVEAEIQELVGIDASELAHKAWISSRSSPGYVSAEALLHVVRHSVVGVHREKLIESLLRRIVLLAPRADDANGSTASLTRANIRDDIVDHFIDLLLNDQTSYDDRLDYYEINFNSAIAKDRKDASDRHWRRENRSEEISLDDFSDIEHAEFDSYDPFDNHELDEKYYRLRLDDAIDSLPELQRRIVEMLRQEIPIDSKDSTTITVSKALGKSEKTIRTHRDKAFAALRLRLDTKGKF